jgi:phasin family protein
VQLFSVSGKQTQEAAEEAAQRMQAVAQSSTALVRGLQEVSRTYFEMTQNRFQKNVEALAAFSLCRSIPEFVEAQTTLVRQNVELTLENSQRLAQLSVQVLEEAAHTVAVDRGPRSDGAQRAA